MIKVTTQAFPSYSISHKENKKSSLIHQKNPQKDQGKFHNQTFVKLKKLNENLALIQKTQGSLHQIQRELKEIQQGNPRLSQSHTLEKLANLQAKLTPILEQAKNNHLLKIPSDLSFNNLKDLQQKLSIEQNKLKHQLDETTQKIQSFFASSKEFDLQDEMLKNPRFKEAHNTALLSPSMQTLTYESL